MREKFRIPLNLNGSNRKKLSILGFTNTKIITKINCTENEESGYEKAEIIRNVLKPMKVVPYLNRLLNI